jgi:hypothetical protein
VDSTGQFQLKDLVNITYVVVFLYKNWNENCSSL